MGDCPYLSSTNLAVLTQLCSPFNMTTQDLEERILNILSGYSSDGENEWHGEDDCHEEDECHSIVSTNYYNLSNKKMDSFKTQQDVQLRLENLEQRDLTPKENILIYVIAFMIITLIFVVVWFS
jgi:hypothetical protein